MSDETLSAEIVNLRRARKAVARAGHEAAAVTNRARHGRTKGEREAQRLETTRAARALDGARREQAAPSPDGD